MIDFLLQVAALLLVILGSSVTMAATGGLFGEALGLTLVAAGLWCFNRFMRNL